MSGVAIGQQLQSIFGDASLKDYTPYSKHIFSKLHQCHTAAMGMHFYKCNDAGCSHIHQQYHSCGNPPAMAGPTVAG